MKKNMLFIIPDLSAGGGERSLINLLSQIDYNLYDVDLFMFDHKGLFMELLPKEVHLLSLPESYQLFTLPLFDSIKEFLLQGKLSLAYNRLMYTLKNRYNKNLSIREQYNWKYLRTSLEVLPKNYDSVIGFLEKTSTYFCIDKVDACKRIGWIHNDYDQLGLDPNYDIYYFNKLTNIITVSEECANVLKNRFPSQKSKVAVIHNIVSPRVIHELASQTNDDVYGRKKDEIIILSIGRLHYQKGFEFTIEACKLLVEKGYNIKWNIIGEGGEREKLTKLIKESNVEDHVFLLGQKTNPYPYIKQADIYAQTSRFEGKSIAIDEAKILHKPILVTNFSTAKDQITDGENGLIVEMNPDAIANGMEELIKDKVLRNWLIENLTKENLGTEEEINKLYALL